jgi:plastocyanin
MLSTTHLQAAAPREAEALSATIIELIASADARTQSGSPDTNFGSGLLWVGHPNVHNVFVQFDLSVLPANATINAAELRLEYTGVYTTPNSVEVGRVEGSWDEATLTYGLPQPAITWGGPIQPVSVAGPVSWNVTALVTQWQAGARPNYGFGLRGLDGPLLAFHSRDNINLEPKLVLTYTTPADDGSPRPDLGDAPDSSNSLGIPNTAYPGVPGNFPTVWGGTPAGQPAGPRHANQSGEGVLGEYLSRENEADSGPDQDNGHNNILDGGADNADNDRGDDGWRNRNIRFFDCQRQTLTIRISKAQNATLNKMHLNVWFDGNRDGDWEDTAACQPEDEGPAQASYEWIVQDYFVDMTAVPAGGFLDIQVTTERVLNATPGQAHWMRFMLSEELAVKPPLALADGRGPHPGSPLGSYKFGETEDVLQKPAPAGEPGELVLEKSVATSSNPVLFGDMVTYEILLRHEGGTQPIQAVIRDELPYPLHIHPQVIDSALHYVVVENPEGSAGPLLAALDLKTNPIPQPPTQVIHWQGTLAPDSAIRLTFDVHVLPLCGPNEQTQTMTNLAQARPKNGNTINDEANFSAACPGYEGIVVVQHGPITDTLDSLIDWRDLPLQAAVLNPSPYTATLRLLHSYATNLPGAASTMETPRLLGQVTLAPGATQWVDFTLRMENEFSDELMLPADFAVASNLSFCIMPGGDHVGGDSCPDAQLYPQLWGQAQPLTFTVRPSDLGDAPDSTNHAGVAMTAYPNIAAHFPTVFDPATGAPEGPRHSHPRPLHLGPQVSREAEADIGPDQDGVNNIEPAANIADLDAFDDGSRLQILGDCAPAYADAQIAIGPAAVNWFQTKEHPAYLNIWLDLNRDGDWDDGFTCQAPGGQVVEVVEHILIDFPVDVVGLGAGLHPLQNLLTRTIVWPAALAQEARWMRFTLSERPSNKTFIYGAVNYSDGRGYPTPFQTGETEDKLFQPVGGGDNGPDLAVKLDGRVTPNGEQAQFKIEVANRGTQDADGAILTFHKPPQLRDHEIALLRAPGIADEDISNTGETIRFLLPYIEQDNIIAILIGLTIPASDGSNKELAASAGVELAGDIDPGNNQANVTTRGLLSSPLIGAFMDYTDDSLTDALISGRAVTCQSNPTLGGQAQPNSTVEILSDGIVIGTAQADGNGHFFYNAVLDDGLHRIHARYPAQAAAAAGDAALMLGEEGIYYLLLKVDGSLPIDPLSLTLTDSQGRTHRPATLGYSFGATQTGSWLHNGETYEVGVNRCGNDPNVTMALELENTLISNFLRDDDGDGRYTGSFTYQPAVQAAQTADAQLRITVTSSGVEQHFTTMLQPVASAIVRDGLSGQPLAGASVVARSVASLAQLEPQVTGADGSYGFIAPDGVYRLDVTLEGYQRYQTDELAATTGMLAQEIMLTPVIDEEASETIQMTDSGFEPAILTVPPGSVVEWVNMSFSEHSAIHSGTGGWDSGLLPVGGSYKIRTDEEGVFTYVDTANPLNQATLIINRTLPEPLGDPEELYLPLIVR